MRGAYAELVAATNFSFLRGASPAEELVLASLLAARTASASPTAIRWRAWSGLMAL